MHYVLPYFFELKKISWLRKIALKIRRGMMNIDQFHGLMAMGLVH